MIIPLHDACTLLLDGRIVALPTETVYGLAGLAKSDMAVASIYATKKRPSFNPLIVHVADWSQAQTIGHFTPLAHHLAAKLWPGPLTLVVPAQDAAPVSKLALCGLPTVAIRMPQHPIMQGILSIVGPLVAPSANPSGLLSSTSAQHVETLFKGRVAVVDGGLCGVGLESTIVDCCAEVPRILRSGGLADHKIAALCGGQVQYAQKGDVVVSPGMLLRHYAPSKPLYINRITPEPAQGFLTFGPYEAPPSDLSQGVREFNLSPTGDLHEAAAHLFDFLHQADADPLLKSIAVMPIPDKGLGLAINDRLRRGALS